MDEFDEDPDQLNEETFGCAETGDWELEHEQFAINEDEEALHAPEADQLPKFWESTDDSLLLWGTNSIDPYSSLFDDSGERGVDVEQTLQKLLLEDEKFEDPAIIDISRKVSGRNFRSSAIEKLLIGPAYPNNNILNMQKDIWSINKKSPSMMSRKQADAGNGDSINLFDLLKQLRVSTTNNTNQVKNKVDSSTSTLADVHDKFGPITLKDLISSSKSTSLVSDVPAKQPLQMSASTGRPQPTPISFGFSPAASVPTELSPKSHVATVMQTSPSVTSDNHSPMAPRFMFPPNLPPDQRTLQFLLWHAQQKPPFNARLTDRFPMHNTLMLSPPPFGQPIIYPPQSPITLIHPSLVSPTHMSAANPCSPTGMFIQPFPIARPPAPIGIYSALPAQNANVTSFEIAHTDSDQPFDVDVGGWMTKFESVGVLLAYLRPLIVSNPYVQDYYFALRWLRMMTATRAKQIANGAIPCTAPLPVVHVPSPVGMDNLLDPNHHHQLTLNYKLIMPLALIPSLCRPLSPDTTTQSDEDEDDRSSTSTPVDQTPPQNTTSSPTSTTATSTTLGRPTCSNINRPRVVADISLASALSKGVQEVETSANESQTVREKGDQNPSTVHSSILLKSARRKRLLLARIERMYSLLLNLDEVDMSIARVMVHNELRARLLRHRATMLNHLADEFFGYSSETNPGSSITSQIYMDDDKSLIFLNILSIRKGIRLFSVVLNYLPQHLIDICLREFVLRYESVQKHCITFDNECSTLLYPSLRRALYKTTNIESFMSDCFPDMNDNWADDPKPSQRIACLISTKLGLSLIFCFLDVCARLSRPEDPSSFVRYAAYFAYQTVTYQSQTGSIIHPIETFPHLASIVSVYLHPTDHHRLLSTNHIKQFRCLIHDPKPSEPFLPQHFPNLSTPRPDPLTELASNTLPSTVNNTAFSLTT